MIPTLLLEPGPSDKRRAYSKTVAGPAGSQSQSVDRIRQRLKEMRRSALNSADRLADQLTGQMAADPDVHVSFAENAGDAVAQIEKVMGKSNTIAVSKSAVVSQELLPGLRNAGFRIVNSYLGELQAGDIRFNRYWQLPRITADAMAESFSTVDLADLRARSIEKNGVKDVAGLLGVNAISASDGSVFLMQHAQNIGKIFQQASKLILVAGLDKICKDPGDALFQSMCMGLFGWDARLLGLGSPPDSEANLDGIPFAVSALQGDPRLHVIILDNGRRKILQSQYRDLFTCIGCRACIKSCPTQRFFGEKTEWSPKEYLYSLVLGQNRSVELCLGCGMCRVECPVGIDIPAMMLRARYEFSKPDFPSGMLLGNFESFAKVSSISPGMANSVLKSKLARRVAEKSFGIDKDAGMPQFTRNTFPRWFNANRHEPWKET